MTEQQEAEFVEQAFEKLKERGWFADHRHRGGNCRF